MRVVLTLALSAALASPVLAAGGDEYGFVSLKNTDFIVLISFIVFIGILVYFGVPKLLVGMLDQRAQGIRAKLDEARALREEAQTLLASYKRKQMDVKEQADRIVATAKEDAEAAAEQAKADLQASITRRMAAAEDQIASAEASAVREVRDQAIVIAVAAARDVIGKQMTAANANKLIDDAIVEVEQKLH